MKSFVKELPLALETTEVTIRQIEWGGLTLEYGQVRQTMDLAAFFKGLPDDRCQCPHWGYVLNGQLRYRYQDREEVFEAGQIYYAPPGHTPVFEAGLEYVEFSPTDQLAKTMEVVERNLRMEEGT